MFEALQSFSFSAACSPGSQLPLLHTVSPWGSILLWAQDGWDLGLQTDIPENVNQNKSFLLSSCFSKTLDHRDKVWLVQWLREISIQGSHWSLRSHPWPLHFRIPGLNFTAITGRGEMPWDLLLLYIVFSDPYQVLIMDLAFKTNKRTNKAEHRCTMTSVLLQRMWKHSLDRELEAEGPRPRGPAPSPLSKEKVYPRNSLHSAWHEWVSGWINERSHP